MATTGAQAEFIIDPDGAKQKISVQFNPSEYSISRSVGYTASHGIAPSGKDTNKKQRGATYTPASSEATLRLKLTLDGFVKANTTTESKAADITDDVKAIKKMLLVAESEHHPPTCAFHWGTTFFKGYLTSAEEHYTMFSSSGNILRATIDLTIKEADPQKLSLESPDRTKQRTVIQGERIYLLADEAYRDPTLWRPIAKANSIKNPRKLLQGSALIIPPLDEESPVT
jgi:nucleoid-associated protein YgaU